MGKIFKQSMMGFNKEQVIAYIDALLEKQKSVVAAEKEKYNQLIEENEKLLSERDEETEKLKTAEEAEDAAGLKIKELELSVESLTQDKHSLEKSCDELKEKLTEQENKNKELSKNIGIEKIKLQNAEKKVADMANAKSECEILKAKITQLEAEAKNRRAKTCVVVKKEDRANEAELFEKTEVLWENFREKINDLADELSELSKEIKQSETDNRMPKSVSIKDILEKVKRIGEKL